ncbi:MAG: hypothetical protein JWR33_2265 [Naasia sp.]|jgi:hypothetical protein|uniref:hypothetical protein n=1 Tax=Naasia sp. TaxID=2546198 RepID=UPI00262A3E04|nr:hypothetical protein [Naasia sp.]MCU1571524.1 hypothetical protein [Naasia sp.]
MSGTPEEIAARIDERVRREWPGTHAPARKLFIAPEVQEGGVTDTLLRFVQRIVEEELRTELTVSST